MARTTRTPPQIIEDVLGDEFYFRREHLSAYYAREIVEALTDEGWLRTTAQDKAVQVEAEGLKLGKESQ